MKSVLLACLVVSVFFCTACDSGSSLSASEKGFLREYVARGKEGTERHLRLGCRNIKQGNLTCVETRAELITRHKVSFLSDASLTTLSTVTNALVYVETRDGKLVRARYSRLAGLSWTREYIALMRRRITHQFARYYGYYARNRERYVQEKLRLTMQSMREGLPHVVDDMRFHPSRNHLQQVTRIRNRVESNSRPLGKAALFPFALRDRLRRLAREGKTAFSTRIVLPADDRLAVRDVTLTLSRTNGGYGCSLQPAGAALPLCSMALDKNFIPERITIGESTYIRRTTSASNAKPTSGGSQS